MLLTVFAFIFPVQKTIGQTDEILIDSSIPEYLQIKAKIKNDIKDVRTEIDDKNNEIIVYDYINGLEVSEKPGEIKEKRQKNARFYNINNKNIIEIYNGSPFYEDKESGKWYQVESATTTINAWNKQFLSKDISLFDKLITKTAKADYYAGPGDGYISRTAVESMDANRNNTSGTSQTTSDQAGSVYSAYIVSTGYRYTRRVFYPFDTSVIPDNAIISSSSVYVWFYGNVGCDNTCDTALVENYTPSNSSLSLNDYDLIGIATGSPNLLGANNNYSGYNQWKLSDRGISWINKTGYTKLAMRTSLDQSNTTYPNDYNKAYRAYMSEWTGTDKDPKILVEYTIQELNNEMILATSTIEQSTSTDIALITQKTFLNEDGTIMYSEYTVNYILFIYIFLLFLTGAVVFFLWKDLNRKK